MATSRERVHCLQRFPCLRYVPSLSFLSPSTVCSALALTGLFHPAAASRVHPRSGALTPRTAPPNSSPGGCPLVVRSLNALRPVKAEGHIHEPRLRGFVPREDAWLVPQGLVATRLAPLFGFSVSSRIFDRRRYGFTPRLPLLTLPVNTYCFRTRTHWPTSASYQRSTRLGHL